MLQTILNILSIYFFFIKDYINNLYHTVHAYVGKINNSSDIFVFIYVCLFCVKLMPEISLKTTKSKVNKRAEFLSVDTKDFFRICVCFRVYDSFIIKEI